MSRRLNLIASAAAIVALQCAATPSAVCAQTLAVINAKLLEAGAAAPASDAVILIENGRIVQVGPGVRPPPGAKVIDAEGRIVTTGFFAASTSLSVIEVDGVMATHDDTAGGKIGAAFDIGLGVNPASTLIPLARKGGITRAMVTPTGGRGFGGAESEDGSADTAGGADGGSPGAGLFDGLAAGVTLMDGARDAVFRPRAAMVVDLGDAGARSAGSHGGALQLLKASLEEAKIYAARRPQFERGQSRAFSLSQDDLEALAPVAEGRLLLLVRVHRASDIRQVLKLKAALHLKVAIEGAEEGWLVADELAAAKVPVLIDTEADLPQQFESLGSRLDNAARLERAGVMIAIEGSRDFDNLRQARFNAGTAVSYGLPYGAAIAALTINPAKIFGLEDEVGALKPGRQADLVIWSGDPLETSSAPTRVFISGVEQPLESRGDKLAARYAHPDDGMPSAYH
jgi:imidazolonepropionase-like amidohydrolase